MSEHYMYFETSLKSSAVAYNHHVQKDMRIITTTSVR